MEVYTLWLACTERTEACEKTYLERLIAFGYLKKDGSPNVLIFNENAKSQPTEKLTALKEEIKELFKKAPHIQRGYVVEQAIENGWLVYDERTLPTVGAYIYM